MTKPRELGGAPDAAGERGPHRGRLAAAGAAHVEDLEEGPRAELGLGEAGGGDLRGGDGATALAAQEIIEQALPRGGVVEDVADQGRLRGLLDEVLQARDGGLQALEEEGVDGRVAHGEEDTVPHVPTAWRTMNEHKTLAFWTAGLFTALSAWRFFFGRRYEKAFLLGWVLAAGVLAATGWHGGELVFRHGVGFLKE